MRVERIGDVHSAGSLMAQCVQCGAETELYDAGVPIVWIASTSRWPNENPTRESSTESNRKPEPEYSRARSDVA